MSLSKTILNICLSFINFFVLLRPVKQNQVSLVSLEGLELKDDFKIIYDSLQKNLAYKVKIVLFNYNKKTALNNLKYFFNCFRQLIVINRSKVVLINDNNYVVSNFKRKETKVIQVWHASGAIKKFGNALKRKYKIQNYDYVLANSSYWQKPYSQAFNVKESNVIVTGLPRLDVLVDDKELLKRKQKILTKYPIIKDKNILLYAPTFRGNVYQGFKAIDIDLGKISKMLGDDWLILVKHHPLLTNYQLPDNSGILDCSQDNTYDLFTVSTCLVSDYSSIILDYTILNRPIYLFGPDYQEYGGEIGYYLNPQDLPGPLVSNEEQLVQAIANQQRYPITDFAQKMFTYQDGKNNARVLSLIKDIIENHR